MQSPVVIGGLGGSGTRVVARILKRAGYFMGTNLTGAEDAIEFWEFYDRWINRYLLRHQAPLSKKEDDLMERDFSACVARHRLVIPAPDAPWGWKNPRSILLLPFLNETFPGMKYLHVVRDGRDMAFSASAQDQVRQHGTAILGSNLKDAPEPVRTSACWARINLEAASYGDQQMGDRYLAVKFEKLCVEPRENVQRILSFLGSAMEDPEHIGREVIALPESIGRWRACADGTLLRDIEAHAQAALAKFGYY
jgi:hypothetical protein